tara:strand:+ start:2876 stop:4129 length:1254 start_codon:yes stop_codon:yes gene_type:complete
LLDLLIVNPNNRIVSPFAGIEPPLWAGLIASHYKQQGLEVAILDAEALDYPANRTAREVRNLDPKKIIIVVMGNNPSASSTPKMKVAKSLIGLLRDYPISVTGLHPSALPEETERELGVPALRGKIFDGMPGVSWELLPMEKYTAHNWHCLDDSPRSPYASVYTSLGCPFSCSFCNVHVLYGDKRQIQYRNHDAVIAEIDLLVNKYNVKNIKFWDELFTLNGKHVKNICLDIITREYDLNIWAYARVDSSCISLDILKIMKKAGINWLAYGFESGNDTVLSGINKKANQRLARLAVLTTHRAKINIIGNFIFGLPGDTEKTMQETLEFAKSLDLEYANFYVAKAYPGSLLYEGNKDWASYDQFSRNGDKVSKFRDKAFTEFFTDPTYLHHIMAKFGGQAVMQIKDMLKLGKPSTRSS